MPHRIVQRPGRHRRVIGALVATALLGSGLTGLSGSAVAAPPTGAEPTARYLVQLDGEPLATYAGGVAGFAATKPAAGAKLNRASGGATAYRTHLRRQQEQVLQDAGVPQNRPRVTLDTAFNGFAMELTRSQALRLRGTRGVRAVYDNRKVHTLTSHTPDYLGLTGRDGVWREQFGDVSRAGEGVIVGVIDSGFWPESASFAPLPSPRPDQAIIDAKWRGTCDVGVEAPVTCNNKVIGARWYNDSGIAEAFPDEFSSPRDRNGHGTHTASTAAGLHGVPAKSGAEDLGRISGMAPAARLAIYKALYDTGEGGATGTEIDIVHAVDDAVADGVDVINYSVGDDSEYFGAIDAAFFNAAAAGVFVSAAAGNAGPTAGTVDNSTPWVTTVAASTTDRQRARTLTLGDGTTVTGAGLGDTGVGPARLVSAKDGALDAGDTYNAERCVDGTLDPAKVTGAIVVCLRGDIARTDKSRTVARAGGVGMVLYNDELGSLSADAHTVPTVHIDEVDGARVLAYLASGQPTASLSPAALQTVESPSVAAFSSAGPSAFNAGELIKPDISAPGQDIAAAFSPSQAGNDFALASGTSMAAPHIAGIAALLLAEHPGWSPATVRSALMTTASDVTDRGKPIKIGSRDATPLNYGSGQVRPGSAFDPGLVYDSTAPDWLRYLCGVAADRGGEFGLDGLQGCAEIGPIDTAQLNYPSISLGRMVGKQQVTRTVTNVGRKTSTYTASVQAPRGYHVKVTPAKLTIKPGRTARFTVEVTNISGAFDTWADGALTWRDSLGHRVRTPLVVRNAGLIAPDAITGTGTSGSTRITAEIGYPGRLITDLVGLTAGTASTVTLSGDGVPWDWSSSNNLPVPLPPSMYKGTVHVPGGAREPYVRVTSRLPICSHIDWEDEEGVIPCTEFSVEAYDMTGKFVNATVSGGWGATLRLPEGEADYILVLEQAFLGNMPPGQDSETYTITTYVPGAPSSATGKLSIDPKHPVVRPGQTVNLTVRWSGLLPGRKYIGYLVLGNGSGPLKTLPITVQS
ncbi:S8 family serine peptidase [Catellatospora chokoriensis]|uniref:S8 family serine peptidase n=1 Tax=Catellatospora chokoriensis TaxID=310353 RepID=UPI001782EA56|nr:S8 family serine peptidase [Catellatospora chokoriensis]